MRAEITSLTDLSWRSKGHSVKTVKPRGAWSSWGWAFCASAMVGLFRGLAGWLVGLCRLAVDTVISILSLCFTSTLFEPSSLRR